MREFFKSEPTRILIAIHRLNSIIHYFISSFLVIYFLKLTDWDIRLIALNKAALNFVTVILFYVLAFKISNKNIIAVYRMGIVLNAIYVLVIILLGENVINYLILLGALRGFIMAFYWVPRHYMIYEFNTTNGAKKFFGIEGAIEKIQNIVVPIFMGGIISYTTNGYYVLFIIILSVVTLTFVISKWLEFGDVKIESSNFKKLRNYLKSNSIDKIKYMYISDFFRSLSGALIGTVITALIYLEYGSEFGLGVFKSVLAVILAAVMLAISKYLKDKNIEKLLVLSGVLIVLPMLLVLYKVSEVTLILYSVLTGVGFAMLSVIKGTILVGTVKRSDVKKFILENIIVRETVMNTARILAFAGLYFLGNIKENIVGLKFLFIFIIVANIINVLGMSKTSSLSE